MGSKSRAIAKRRGTTSNLSGNYGAARAYRPSSAIPQGSAGDWVEIDWDDRYPANWRSVIVPLAHRLSKRTCCWCLNHRSESVHHAAYAEGGLPIKNREKDFIGHLLFPVCDRCHDPHGVRGGLHSSKYWVKDKQRPKWGNHNTDEATARLRLGYCLIRGSQ